MAVAEEALEGAGNAMQWLRRAQPALGGAVPLDLLVTQAELPPRARFMRHDGERPPRAFGASQEIGRRWLHGGTLALVVPSVIVPDEANYVLNVSHALFGRLAVRQERFSFGDRLWRSKDGGR